MFQPSNANARLPPQPGGSEPGGAASVSARYDTPARARCQTDDLAALVAAAGRAKAAGNRELYWTLRRDFLLAQARDYEAQHESR